MKIITYNIANYNDQHHWDKRVEAIAAELIKLDPDVVAMQEVRFDSTQEQTRQNYQDMAEMVLAAIKKQSGDKFDKSSLVTAKSMFYMGPNHISTWEFPSDPVVSGGEKQYWKDSTFLSKASAAVRDTGNRLLSFTSDGGDGNRRAMQYAQTTIGGKPLPPF